MYPVAAFQLLATVFETEYYATPYASRRTERNTLPGHSFGSTAA